MDEFFMKSARVSKFVSDQIRYLSCHKFNASRSTFRCRLNR